MINQKVALRMLEKLGFSVDVANNGKEALKILKECEYSLVLMDCMMPEMDGFETTVKIRSGLVGNRGIPIIAMTARAMKGDRERCLKEGMNDYISKPIKKERLIQILEEWTPKNPQSSFVNKSIHSEIFS